MNNESTTQNPTYRGAASAASSSSASSISNESNPQNPLVPQPAPAAYVAPGSSATTFSVEDRSLRWERLHTLRNRLVDRMYRLEMDELIHTHRANTGADNNEIGEGSSGMSRDSQPALPTPAARTLSVSTSTAPAPEQAGRQIQVRSDRPPLGSSGAWDWWAFDRASENAVARELPVRSEALRHGVEATRRRIETRRRAAVDNRREAAGEALITLDEFLRESREPSSDNDEAFTFTAPSGSQRGTAFPATHRLRTVDYSRADRRHRTEISPVPPPPEGRLDIIRPVDRVPQVITVPQTLPAATWWAVNNPPSGQQISPTETFDTFINHIRRIGHLQDAMLATIRSRNNQLAAETITTASRSSSTETPGTSISSPPSTGTGASSSIVLSTGPSTATPTATSADLTAATSNTTETSSTGTPPLLNETEARLRAMQTRIDNLTSEFSLLRSTWAVSDAENQGYERSLRRLQEYLPSARRAERVRRGNRGGEVSLLYEDLHADAVTREGELFPSFSRNPNPWGDSDAERNRERMRVAAAWALGREGLARVGAREGSTGIFVTGSTDLIGITGGQSSAEATPSTGTGSTADPFSLSERELQKDLLAAKMEELTLNGMR